MYKYFLILFVVGITACSKNKFLDASPNPSLVVPATLTDYQAILDNDLNMNGEYSNGIVPELGETGADNYFLTQDNYNDDFLPLYQRCYTWQQDVFYGEQINDWNIPYQSIYYTNIVLDGLKNISVDADNRDAYNNTKGSALFYRAHLFYQLAQIFAVPYNKDSAALLPGIPLRLTSSLTEKLNRATLEETYDTILADLKTASGLLPQQPLYATRPSKPACYGLLARTYLAMKNYDSAYVYANACFQLQNNLIDYNTADQSQEYPFSYFNDEDIFQCEMIIAPDVIPVNPYLCFVDTSLYNSYAANDLRKLLFFKPSGNYYYFTGSYSGAFQLYAGIATDEIYLIRAECEARKNNLQAALNDLNTLLIKRYSTGTFIPYTLVNTPDMLDTILNERRKELCFRGLRWTDLRRLNSEGKNIFLERDINNQQYFLLPNDKKYVYPIPQPVISFNPGMQQNER